MRGSLVLLSYANTIRIVLYYNIAVLLRSYMSILWYLMIFWSIPLGCFIAMVHEKIISLQRFFVSDGTCDEIRRYSSGFRSRDHIAHDIKIAVRISTTLTRLDSNMVNRIFVSGLASNFAGLTSHGFYAKIGEDDGDLRVRI